MMKQRYCLFPVLFVFACLTCGINAQDSIQVKIERDDYPPLRMNRSSSGGPLGIGSKRYDRGLGTHSVSVLRFKLPVVATKFEAEIGVNINAGKNGSVTFAVEVGGNELYRSGICRGGEEPVVVSVDLPAGTRELVLKVDDGGDGPPYDQADWAEARITTETGKVLYLDEAVTELPFSFQYDGRAVDLATFHFQSEAGENTDGFNGWCNTYTAPDGKLQITINGKKYKNYPVTEHTVSLTNLSRDEDTKIISDFQSLDIDLANPRGWYQVPTLNTLRGSFCIPTDFTPLTVDLGAGASHSFATPSGRSSEEVFPFIELNLNDNSGWFFAPGWTGGWAAKFANQSNKVNVKIGMIDTHFKLLPGETVIQPGVVIFQREGKTRREFKTLVHSFMLDHKVPRDTQGEIIPPILAVTVGGGNKTPQMMLDTLQYCIDNKFPFDTYWIDAGWYGAPHEVEPWSNCGPAWYRYVGDWRVNTTVHPTGTLLPIADAVHANNMKLLVWFEPERIYHETPIYSERPEYRNGPLLDLGNPEARKWIQGVLFDMIEKHGIDIYRQDFNMNPGPVWKDLDNKNPERVGIAEAKHIGGLYTMLDEMRQRFPNILQENCASGGRRLDIEMATRAHSYCQSDYFIGPKPEDRAFILGQNATLNTTPYLPFHGGEFNCVPIGDDYAAFSIISSGTICTFSDFDGGIVRRTFSTEETEWFQKVFAFDARMKKFYTGNFYPLCDETDAADDVWCGWQFDRNDLGAGFAVVFRRGKATEESKTFSLGNIDPDAEYDLEFYDGSKSTVKGNDLKQWKVTLPQRSFQLFLYTKK